MFSAWQERPPARRALRDILKRRHAPLPWCSFSGPAAEPDDAEWCEEEAGEAGPPLRCPLCPFETRVRESLSRHRRLHARRPLSCPHCDAHYLDQTSLARHLLGHQGGKGALLACPECGTHFTRRDTLEQHMSMHAQRDKPFKCSLCTESFLT